MSEKEAILIFIIIVAVAVLLAVAGIMLNIKKAAKLFKDDDKDETDDNDE